MSTLTIRKDISLNEIEDMLGGVPGAAKPIRLRAPNSLKEQGGLGIEARLIQLIATSLRCTNNELVFHSYANEAYSASDFEDLCSRMYGICLLALADTLLTASGTVIKKRVALESAAQRIDRLRNLQFSQAFKGSYLGVPCIKIPGYQNELNNPFYNNEAVVGPDKFYKVTSQAIQAVVPPSICRRFLDERVVSNISEIVRELFTNTDKHARRDERGNILSKNFRCVIFNYSPISEKRITAWLKSGGGHKVKFAANWLSLISQNAVRLLEISVVDTGPGFARRWLNKGLDSISREEEVGAILSCFKKYQSTVSIPSSGSGLTNALQDIRKLRGWFGLRTGHVFVEKAFLSGKESLSVEEGDITNIGTFAEGSVATFLIPMSAIEKA